MTTAGVSATTITDWPKYRFDLANTGTNQNEATISVANVSTLGLAWSDNQHFASGASPVVVNGVLYLSCQSQLTTPATPEICAVNAANGQLMWHRHVGSVYNPSTAAVSGGRVYVGGDRPATMYALDAATGSVIWSTPTASGFDAHAGAAPVVANGIAYMSFDDGLLHAYNATTGAELWHVFLNSVDTTPALADNVLYVEGGSPGDSNGGQPSLIGVLYALDPLTGRILWNSNSQYGYAITSPTVANGLVFVGSENDNSHLDTNLLAYSATGCPASPCQPVWQVGEPATPFSSPAYFNGTVYEGYSDGKLYAVDASNGALRWTGVTNMQTPSGTWAVQGAPVIANGVVYAGDMDGNIYAWNAAGCGQPQCQPLWSASADLQDTCRCAQVQSQPAVVNGTVYVNSSDWSLNLYAFRLPAPPAPTPTPTSMPTRTPAPTPTAMPTPPPRAIDNQNHLYTLDGWGGVHANGSAPALSSGGWWPNWDIARGLAIFADGTGGYLVDGWGGVHPVGAAPAVESSGWWPNWDIARGIVLAPWASALRPDGWILDGWGGLHPFGQAPRITDESLWPNWDIARGVVILPDSTPTSVAGYTLDGWGGLHSFGGASAVAGAFWPNWDIARALTLLPGTTRANPGGYTLDGWGGVHPFGAAPAVSLGGFWPNWDIARGIVPWTAASSEYPGGWVLDGWGGLHPFGAAPAVSSGGWWPNWDIARGLGGSGSGSRKKPGTR